MEVVDEARDENEHSQDVTEREERSNDLDVKEEVFDVETSDQSSVKRETKPVRIPKYGVKVVMLSIPSMTELYEEVCGYDFTKQITRHNNTYFNRLVSFISFKNQNNGYSLVGGKFNLELDGLM